MNRPRSMTGRYRWKFVALCAGALSMSAGEMFACSAVAAPAPDAPAGAQDAGLALRVATIGYRIAVANVSRCPHRVMASGLVVHDLAAYDDKLRSVVADQLGLGNGFGIRAVIPDGPADRAGLQAGDELIAMGSQDLRAFRSDLFTPRASFSRSEAFAVALSGGTDRKPIQLSALRKGEAVTVQINLQPACDVGFTVQHASGAEAWTDGRYVAVTDALVRLLGDSELAFAIAHEVAHVALGHPQRPRRPLAAIGFGSGRIRAEEAAADQLGVHLAASAGYSPEGAARMFTTLAQSGEMAASLTHPSTQKRIAAVENEARLIKDEN